DAPRPDGWDVFGTYTYWADWEDAVTGAWHVGQLGAVQNFTLSVAPQTTLGGTGQWNLGDQALGGAKDTPVSLTNTGADVLLIDHLSLGGLNPGDFAVASENCTQAAIAPGATCALQIHFAPAALGARAATLLFQANTTPAANTINLIATGVAPPV